MLYSLSLRKKYSQIDKQLFFDFYGVSLLSDEYLEQNPYAKEYKDMIVSEIKELYVPLITKIVYVEFSRYKEELNDWKDWQKIFSIKTPKELTLEQLQQIYNEGNWNVPYGGSTWGHITESLIQLINTTDTNQLITIIDHINDLEHYFGSIFNDYPQIEEWLFDALDIKATASTEQLIPYLSTDVQKLVSEDLKLRGQEVVTPEKYMPLSLDEKQELAQTSTDPKTLTELARDKNRIVRLYVAQNHYTPPEILTELAKDPNMFIRQNVMYNKHTLPEIRKRLKKELKGFASNRLSMRKKSYVMYNDRGKRFEVIQK